ncbi:MAG: sulfatase-like hydrolase/transferase [Alteraurantiacibacter sp.]
MANPRGSRICQFRSLFCHARWLITGRYQYRVRVGLDEPLQTADIGLPPEHPTLPSLLRAQGYHTALVGKWHPGLLPDYGPLKSGYDEFWGNRGGGVDYFTHQVAGQEDLWDGDVQIEEVGYYTDMLADRSIEFMDARAAEPEKPWLLSLHFTAPHWPWEGTNAQGRAESERIAREGSTLQDCHPGIYHFEGGSLETYAEMVTNLDANIGRVLARVAQLGMGHDTGVVVTSDNGGERFSFNWPFRGIKTELLEGGMRVPLIVKWPGLTNPGTETDVPALSMDFLPTFLSAAGGSTPAENPSDGVNLRPVLAGGILPERTLYWRFVAKDQKAVRRGEYKYLSIAGEEYLFNVIDDPRERANLRGRMPEKFADLKAAFSDWIAGMLTAPDAATYRLTPRELADHFGWDS